MGGPFVVAAMPMKASDPATEYEEIDRWEGGVGWIAHPEEKLRRASHALATDAGVWVVDPIDAPGVDDLFAEFGDVAGVIVLLGRHERDAAAIAARHDVPVSVPSSVEPGIDLDGSVEHVTGTLPGTDYRCIRVTNWPGWREAALYDGETLVVADALGTADYMRVGAESIAVHPALRMVPPTSLGDLDPERILVGHGEGVFERATPALRDALDGARTNLPRAWWQAARSMVG